MPTLSDVPSPSANRWIVNDGHSKTVQSGRDPLALVSGDDNHRRRMRGERLLGGDADQRFAADLGDQFVGTAHAGAATGRQNDRSDARLLPGRYDNRLGARLWTRYDLHQQTTDAHAGDVGARNLKSSKQPHQHPVEAVFLRRARTARRAQQRPAAGLRDQQQIAGIDRHAEMLDAAADRLDRRRDHIAPVGDGRSSKDEDELGAGLQHIINGTGECLLVVGDALLGNDRGAGGRQALGSDPQCLVDDLVGKAGQQRRHHADLANPIWRNPHKRSGLFGCGDRAVAGLRRDREWNDFHRGDHFAFDHRLERRQGCEGDQFINQIEIIDRGLVDHQDASRFREQIGAPGKGAVDANALPRDRRGDVGGGNVLRHIRRLHTRHNDLADAGQFQTGNFRFADDGAFLQNKARLADRMHRHPARGLAHGDGAEFHDRFSAGRRRAAVISPMIDTAISAGDMAPIAKPIGARMRSRSVLLRPSAVKRSIRRA